MSTTKMESGHLEVLCIIRDAWQGYVGDLERIAKKQQKLISSLQSTIDKLKKLEEK